MKKQISLILLFASFSFGQGLYGSLGYRINQTNGPISLSWVKRGFSYAVPDEITKVDNNNSFIMGTGYRWLAGQYFPGIKKIPLSTYGLKAYHNFFVNLSFNSFDYKGMDYGWFRDGKWSGNTYTGEKSVSLAEWSVGTGLALRFSNDRTIFTDLEFHFTLLDDESSFDRMSSGHFVTLNFSVGLWPRKTKKNALLWDNNAILGTKILGNQFLNKYGPSVKSTQLSGESKFLGYVTGLGMILWIINSGGGTSSDEGTVIIVVP